MDSEQISTSVVSKAIEEIQALSPSSINNEIDDLKTQIESIRTAIKLLDENKMLKENIKRKKIKTNFVETNQSKSERNSKVEIKKEEQENCVQNDYIKKNCYQSEKERDNYYRFKGGRENEEQSSIPYRAHPLFNFIKNFNTINQNEIIRIRNGDSNQVTTLILKPMAKAIAAQDGKAMAVPISRALLRRGMNVDILFEPDAVAIAGPGGVAHAQSELEITYEPDG